jgi:hypothetical protein
MRQFDGNTRSMLVAQIRETYKETTLQQQPVPGVPANRVQVNFVPGVQAKRVQPIVYQVYQPIVYRVYKQNMYQVYQPN